MDPLSIITNVITIIAETLRTAKGLYDLRAKFEDASVTITSIYSESMVISASLSQVQGLLLHDALQHKPDLRVAFDTALTGCMVVYSCLDAEVQRLAGSAPQGGELGWGERSRIVWEEDRMKELLQQIRGQQSAMTLLIQGLQMESLGDIKRLLKENSAALELVAIRSRSLRFTNPRIKVPDSIFHINYDAKSRSDANSVISQAEFEFDDQVVNSKAYRRVMAAAEARTEKLQPRTDVIEGDLINFDDPEDEPQIQALSDTLEELQNLDLYGTGSNTNTPQIEDDGHDPFFDNIEKNYLPFMPPVSSSNTESIGQDTTHRIEQDARLEKRNVHLQGYLDKPVIHEEKPPLPPRRSTSVAGCTSAQTPLLPVSTGTSSYLSSCFENSSSAISSSSTHTASESITTMDSNTAKSVNSSLAAMTPSSVPQRKPLPKKSQSNLDLFNTLSSESDDIKVVSAEEIDRHNTWLAIIKSESEFIFRLSSFTQIFLAPALLKWPVLGKHVEALQMLAEIVTLHQEYLQSPMMEQINRSSFATCNPQIFYTWVTKSQVVYRNYHQRLPHAQHAIRLTVSADSKFRDFVNTIGLRAIWLGKSWEDFTSIPTQQLQSHIDNLGFILRSYGASTPSVGNHWEAELLDHSLKSLWKLQSSCQLIQERSLRREQIQTLHRRIQTLNADYLNQLNLSNPARRIIHQGSLAVRVKGKGPWLPTHGVLLDSHLFWGKVQAPKAADAKLSAITEGKFWLLEEPLTITELSFSLPDNDNQFIKASIVDEVPRGSVIYQVFVKTNTHTHTLGAFSVQERQLWVNKIGDAIFLQGSEKSI